MRRRQPQPDVIASDFCNGCKSFGVTVYRVAPYRYRCDECRAKEAGVTKPPKTEVDVVIEMMQRIEPVLAGHPPEVQGAALMHLTLTWLLGHRPPDFRRSVMQSHNQLLFEALLDAEERERRSSS